MEVKRKIKRSRSLSDILKVCIPKSEMKPDLEKKDGQSTERKPISDLVRELYRTASRSKKMSTNKSYRRRRRATLADISCNDILKPIPEMEEEDSEHNGVNQINLTASRRHSFGETGINYNREEDKRLWDVISEEKKWHNMVDNIPFYPEREHLEAQCKVGSNQRGVRNDQSNVSRQQHDLLDGFSENGDDIETRELKNALSNYEIKYDVDEDENANIFDRMEEKYIKNRERSDSISSTTSNATSGSDQSLLSVSPVDEELLHEKMQTVEAPRRRRRFSTSDLHLRCLLRALPSITEESKKSSISSSASNDSNDNVPNLTARRRSSSLPYVLLFREIQNDKLLTVKQKEQPEESDGQHDSSPEQPKEVQHFKASLPVNRGLPSAGVNASKKLKRRNSTTVLEELRRTKPNEPDSTNKNDLSYIKKKIDALENNDSEEFNKKSSIVPKDLVKVLKQKVKASLCRRSSIATAKPWTGIVEKSLRSPFQLQRSEEGEDGVKDMTSDPKSLVSGEHIEINQTVEIVDAENLLASSREDFISASTLGHKSREANMTNTSVHPDRNGEKQSKTVVQLKIPDKVQPHKGSFDSPHRGKTHLQKAGTSLRSTNDEQEKKTPPIPKTNEKLPKKSSSTFSRSSSFKEKAASKTKEAAKSVLSSKSKPVRPESPRLQKKKNAPSEKPVSNLIPRASTSLNRPPSPNVARKAKNMKQEPPSSNSVEGNSSVKTADKASPKTAAAKSQTHVRPSSPITTRNVGSPKVTKHIVGKTSTLSNEKKGTRQNIAASSPKDAGILKKPLKTDDKKEKPKRSNYKARQDSALDSKAPTSRVSSSRREQSTLLRKEDVPKDQEVNENKNLMERFNTDKETPKSVDKTLASDADKAQTSVNAKSSSLLTMEDVPKKQEVEKNKNLIEKVKKEIENFEAEKNETFAPEISRHVPGARKEKTKDNKASVNVIRRLLSPFTITVPASTSRIGPEKLNQRVKESNSLNSNQEGTFPVIQKEHEKPNIASTNNSNPESQTEKNNDLEQNKSKQKDYQNFDLDKELHSFSSLLGEFEKLPPSLQNESSVKGKVSNEPIPTEKRFVALSERYNAIMSKFGMLNKTPATHRRSGTKDQNSELVSLVQEDNVNKAPAVTSLRPVSEVGNHASLSITQDKVNNSGVILPETEDKVSKSFVSPTIVEDKVDKFRASMSVTQNKVNTSGVSLLITEDKVSRSEISVPVTGNEVKSSRVSLPIAEDKVSTSVVSLRVTQDKGIKFGINLPVSEDNVSTSELSRLLITEDKVNNSITSINHSNNVLYPRPDNIQSKVSLKISSMTENMLEGALTSNAPVTTPVSCSVLSEPANTDGTMTLPVSETLTIHPAANTLSMPKTTKIKDTKSDSEERNDCKSSVVKTDEKSTLSQEAAPLAEQKLHSSLRSPKESSLELFKTSSFIYKAPYEVPGKEVKSPPTTVRTTEVSSSEDKNDDSERCSPRTTVIAHLIDRKLGPRRKQSIVPTLAARKSKVFNDSEFGIQGIPLTITQFNRFRSYVEKVNLKSTVRTEALSIHDILNGLNTSLMEIELTALCKECTKTLRTLDALGSLPSYFSSDTIIVNPSGTIKFKHLSSDVTIDELFLAPEHTKEFSSEKTCVFSLAVTLWLAADWKLTEHKKPALSRQFQKLLVSMTANSSTERASFDSILETCESLHTDNEMTSRERCQALLWECQATKDLDKKTVDEKAIEESKRTKAQHAVLMGSVSVAANFKGFLKQSHPTTERNNNTEDTKSRDIINKSPQTEPNSQDINRQIPLRKSSIDKEIGYRDQQANPKPPSPAGSMFSHYHNQADPRMIFSPITSVSGNPNLNAHPNFPSGQSQTSTPTFVPIAVPVPTAGAPPMWYMSPTGMVPFGPMGHHPGYFVPISHGSGSSIMSDSELSGIEEKQVGNGSRPSTSMSEMSEGPIAESKPIKVTPGIKSKIPRPIRDPHRRNPRPPIPKAQKDAHNISPRKEPIERTHEQRKTKVATYISATTDSSEHERFTPNTELSPYRAHTPPVRLRSASVELERQEDVRKPRPRSSTGSLGSSPRSAERTARPSSPVSYTSKSERSRPSSPRFSEGRSSSRPSSPVGSRSSSPVSALISKFEDLSGKQQTNEHPHSVSNLLTKFGSSSLLSEDRLSKGQFKMNASQNKERSYYGLRSGPFRTASAAGQYSNQLDCDKESEALSKSWPAKPTHGQSSYSDTSSFNNSDSLSLSIENPPPSRHRNFHNPEFDSNRQTKEICDSSLSNQSRSRLASSLENLYSKSYDQGKRQGTQGNSFGRNHERSWASMENVHKPNSEEMMRSYGIRKSSSAEILSDTREYRDVNLRSTDQRISAIQSQGLMKALEESSHIVNSYANDQDMGANKLKLSSDGTGNERFENMGIPKKILDKSQNRYLIDKRNSPKASVYDQALDTSRRNLKPAENILGSSLKTNVMKAERDYQQSYEKCLTSSSGGPRLEIPVAIAVMDGERERMSSSAFSTSLFSPSSTVKDTAFFQHPIKPVKEPATLSPPLPLSPSVKDCRPTSYFSSLSFTDLEMKPEKDTTLDRRSDTENHPRATSYQVTSKIANGVSRHNPVKEEGNELDDDSSNVRKLSFTGSHSARKGIEKDGGSSLPNSWTTSNDYLERFEKRLTKTNSLENLRQDLESQMNFGCKELKNIDTNASSVHSMGRLPSWKESFGNSPSDSPRRPLESIESQSQVKGTISSLDFQSGGGGDGGGTVRVLQSATDERVASNGRGPKDNGVGKRSVAKDNEPESRPSSTTERPVGLQSSQTHTNQSSKPSNVPNTSKHAPSGPSKSKPSSVPTTPTSGTSKNSQFFSYSRRQSSPHVASLSEEHHKSKRSGHQDAKKDASGSVIKQQGTSRSTSSKLEDQKTKQSFKPNTPASDTNSLRLVQPSLAAQQQNVFDFSEKAIKGKGQEWIISSQTSPENIISRNAREDDIRVDSSELTSSKWGTVRQLVLRSPTSPTSSSNSSSSSPSPRLPLNKSMFYSPQSEGVEEEFSPTEQIISSGQKGFVITDTSRQSKVKRRPEEKRDRSAPSKTQLNANLEDTKFRKADEMSSMMNKVTKVQTEERSSNVGSDNIKMTLNEIQSSVIAQQTSYFDLKNINLKESNQEIEDKAHRINGRRRSSITLEEVGRNVPTKDTKSTGVSQEGVSGERRKSLDLRQIYNSVRRSSLTTRSDSNCSSISPSTSTTSRPNSALDKRPPSPGRVDSKELLGHLVKKVLNSATARTNSGSPGSSFADGASQQIREPLKTAYLGKDTSSPGERTKSSEKNFQDRGKEYLHERKPEALQERKERKVSHERKHQYVDQQGHDKAREKKISVERKQQPSDQERINTTRERKTSHERKQQHDRNNTKERRRSHEREAPRERTETIERRLSYEKEKQGESRNTESLTQQVEKKTVIALNKEQLKVEKGVLDTSGENDVLNNVVEMIHDEFAFDGYLDDGVEDVNMGEYVMSLSGMNEDMFKESVRDQYSDLYWDDDLLQDMYILVNRKLTSRRPTLRFSESTASDLSRPDSSLSMDPSSDAFHLTTKSVSRSSSERSFLETRDYVMSSLGEPSQFLPFKIICPEITRDIIEELGPVFEDYQREMKIKLAPSISELMEKLGAKILEIGQQLTLERRAKKKNIASFKKVADIEHKKDVKDLASKLLQEIEESDKKIIYLKFIQRRLRNIYAERFGLDHSLLHSFVSSYNITNVCLEPQRQNTFLSFSPLWDQRSDQLSEAHGETARGPVLQYGTIKGLFSYLFARHAMSQAFVRFFLYTFRYCATPNELFEFIRDKCRGSLRADTGTDKTYNHQLQIRYRALDLLAEWVDSCFQFDFKTNPELLQSLFRFLNEELMPVDKTERGKMLVELITEKQRKDQEEHVEKTTDTLSVLQTDGSQGSILEKDSPKKFPIKRKKSPVPCFKRGSPQASSVYKPTLCLKAMSVIDHSSRTIAEQLTLIQQDNFAHAHSIHFLNSRTLGVGVGRLSPTKESTQLDSMLGFTAGRRRSITSETGNVDTPSPKMSSGDNNLFVSPPVTDGCLEDLLTHAQDVSMWVAVEICSAPSVKNQLVLIQKYISVAKYCVEMRNFATSVQVVDALEMFVIRQLPVWKQVPNKVTQTLEELKAIKVLLKTDSSWLLRDNAYREKPTIPCALLFLMHIQQLELGGFTLANGMYKWTKMRSIARLVDQIRLFKQMRYAFESNDTLTDRLRMRIQECREENLHALAAENATNFHLSSSQSSRKFQEAFRKMKATFGNG